MEENKKRVKSKKSRVKNKEIKAKKKDTKLKFKHKHPKLALILKIMIIIFLLLIVIGAGVLIGLVYGLWGDDFKIDMSELVLSDNSYIVDSEGAVLAELSGDENRKVVTLEEMSPYLPKAYIAIEDERYYQHHGVDLKRTAAAILSFVTHGGTSTAGGGSTITQQLVKNVTKDKEDEGIAGILRKVKEWAKAYQVENVMSKDQIIELYLNLIFIGGDNENHGVEIASEYYFNKSAKDLSIAQCAFLAGINHSPNKYNPYKGTDVTELISKRTKRVLSKMKELNFVTQEEYDAAVAEVDAGFQFQNGAKGNVYSSHTDALISQLISQIMEEKGLSESAAKTYLYGGGFKIYSTQVTSIQNVMEEEVKNKKYKVESRKTKNKKDVEHIYSQAAMVVIDPSKGYVVGCVGQLGEKTTSRGQNRATQSTRSTGSSFKPLSTIVPGIDTGTITPATIYSDTYTIFNKGTAQQYDPKNYNGYSTLRSIRSAVTTSQNIPFIKVMAELTPAKCIEYLKKMGISTIVDRDNGLSTAIGGLTYGVSPLEMAGAYATIANNGVYIQPTFYSKVEDSNGKVVITPNQKTERAFSEDTAYIVKNLLTSTITGFRGYAGTASNCRIPGMDVAAKTGTTNDDFDRWLCGFTNYYAGAAWFGFDQPEDVDFSGNPAGQIFASVMKQIHKGLPNSTFEKTANIVSATVCATSGKLASDRCTDTYSEVFIKGHLPETCDAHQGQYTICTESGLLANPYCPDSVKQVKETHYVVEKERLGLWDTPAVQQSEAIPTQYCEIHKETVTPEPETPSTTPEEPEEPEEPETPSEEPEEQEKPGTGEGNEESNKPETGGNTTKPENPSSGGETGSGNTTTGGNTTTN